MILGLSFAKLFWIWAGGLFFIFLPIELFAAKATPGLEDTFSEFCWWAFGVKPRKDGKPIPFRLLRRLTLGLFLFALYLHLVFGLSVIPVVIMSPFLAGVIVYALVRERGK